ncbi:hypothetical protein PF010_g12770 [Phytophthora fragariae]|uniref:Uncharacterized protein n=1 Tax=Phytophthora fragariae TaxID=53985 RepID=A0A6A3KLN7_9STRA|nr:hypothetical protein PF011_g10794 [Phytophthora fragariae]KAE9106041.1 hypothetical protein PF010_g12770 [Phytophthora fragariae]KAE9337467.1 hypothetical protein PF008_g12521 [Phytophthora fragariae]
MVCRYTCFCSTCLALPSATCCYWSSSSSFMAAVATGRWWRYSRYVLKPWFSCWCSGSSFLGGDNIVFCPIIASGLFAGGLPNSPKAADLG